MNSMGKRGFTLIELLLVIGILSVLLAITLVAINPGRQFSQSNNTKRSSDVSAILSAINQFTTGNRGNLPAGITSTAQEISSTAVDLCSLLVPDFIAALPVDPLTNGGAAITNCANPYNTNYQVLVGGSNRVTILAPATELAVPTISVTR